MAAAFLVVAIFAAYWSSLAGPFVFDDIGAIAENSTIRALGSALSPPHEQGVTVGGRPLLNLSFAVNHAISGDAVWSYHALNLLIHIGAALALFGVVRRTLLRPALSGQCGDAATPLAFAVAALWALHPVQTESVTYAVQRAESLMGLFYLLTLYAFVRATECHLLNDTSIAVERVGWLASSVAACALGMATKEVMVSAPLIVLLYDRTFVSGTFRAAWQRHARLYLGLAATWLLLGWLVLGAENRGGTAGFDSGVSAGAYALTQFRAIARYLRLSLWPGGLVFDYGTEVFTTPAEIVPAAVGVAALVIATVFAWRRRPAIGFAGAWFFAILAPSSSIVPVATQTMAEHRMYLPLAGVVGLLVLGLHAWIGRRSLPGLLLAALVCGWLTFARNGDYRSDLALWSDTVAKRPANPRAQNNLGKDLLLAGRVPEAVVHLEQALKLKPDYAKAHNNLGVALGQLGRTPEAIGHFESALRLDPDDGEAHHNLGDALLRTGRMAEAEREYRRALQLRPDLADLQANNRGSALLQAGQVEKAIALFAEALRLRPDFAEAHNNLGNALVQAGRPAEAIEHYVAALRIRPDDAEAHFNLGNVLLDAGRLTEAGENYAAAIGLRPDFAEAHNNLGIVRLRQGNPAGARKEYQAALRSNPAYQPARDNLAKLPPGAK